MRWDETEWEEWEEEKVVLRVPSACVSRRLGTRQKRMDLCNCIYRPWTGTGDGARLAC